MKANELMLGDWIKLPQVLADYSPARVDEINDKGCIAGGWPLLNDEIQPIPLTVGILEKNGWNEWHMYYHLPIDQQQHMQYYPHDGRLRRYYKHKNGSLEQVFEVNAINYVHELQHALRLCGIEKEIEL